MKTFLSCLFLLCGISLLPLHSHPLKFEKNLGWVSLRDLSSKQFGDNFKKYSDQGYLMIDFDAYKVGTATRYAMVWRKNTDKRGWAEYRDMSSAQYNKRWTEFKNKGYRPLDIESYRVNGVQKYAGIWVENKEGYGWSSKRNLTAKQYGDYFQEQKKKGYRIVDMEAYPTKSGIRYAAIWVQNKEKTAWAQLRDMSRESYQKEVDKRSKQGYLVVDFESYQVKGAQKYAAIWVKKSGFGYQVRTNLSELQFANRWREYRDKGYRLVDFERYPTKSGTRYGGVWIENDPTRMRYSKRSQLDKLIGDFQKNNNLPGISVAIVKDGKMVYRRGFGHADKEKKQVAHGESVYLSASISKAIGGTLAVKLEDEGRLRNGRRVNLDLDRTTRSYLTRVKQSNGKTVTLPARHTHTVAQLYAHLGCIDHYDGPEPSTQHYKKAIDALPQIWNASFVSGCNVGSNRNYSTHAHTYIAAVLEKVTGRTVPNLIRTELAQPYGLGSMRAMYAQSSLPSNYERVKPYRDNNNPTSISNNSWKVLGGGIEVSPTDLAWFGWKVLDGKIVRPQARDNILWKRISPSSNGIAWSVGSSGGRRMAEHTGSWTGARTHLRAYRDDGVVIAIMANRRVDGMGTLMNNIGNTVL